MKRISFAITILVAFSLLLAACAPAAAPAATPVIQTKVVESTKLVEATKIVQITNTPAPDRIQVTWYIGVGAGAQPEQIPLEKAFVDKYNKSQTEIQLIPIIVDNKYARDNLTAQIAAGNAPDIVGPMGTAGRMTFPGAFLDLQPLVTEFKYDTSDIDPQFMNFYKDEGKLVGLPFAIFPEFVFVNKNLFKEAKLDLPPQKYGEKYKMGGKEYEWNFETLAMLAKKLTVDAKGNDATSPNFDATKIVQYGYLPQWTEHPRAVGSLYGAWFAVKDGNAQIPQSAADALKWYYDGMWGKQAFIPTQAAIDSDLLSKGNPFSSGKVAMATTHLWYTCCIDAKNVPSWDTAVMPSYNGKVTSKLHGDTFAIMATSKNAKAAFKVYSYMLGAGAADLYKIYGGFPARKGQQAAFLADLDKKFAPNKVNWQVATDSIQYMDVPNHESILTNNWAKIWEYFTTMGSKLRTDGKITDFKKFIDDSVKGLDALFKEKK